MSDIYSRLLLKAGGGIMPERQQAEQEKNVVNIMIGLGGTGISAIRTIKTQVYERLKPDDPFALIPRYQHIAFLGVDTDQHSSGLHEWYDSRYADSEGDNKPIMPLDETEFFYIGNNRIADIICTPIVRNRRRELSWLNDRIPAPDLSNAGAGGIRQVGRAMLADKAGEFVRKVESVLSEAMSGLSGPEIYIHVFSGLSGGTGSGCFLDACYLIRKIIADRHLSATIFGYFYLPDVNLDKVPLTNLGVRDYIPVNGYAAMKELDYCMQIPGNGGAFTQYYKDIGNVNWDCAPVDMCHLICATNESGDVIPNAYDYAMNVSAEYVMDFLTRAYNDRNFDLIAKLKKIAPLKEASERIASFLGYCVIGASCCYVPMREIYTYLASEVFEKFSEGLSGNIPSELDCKRLAALSLARNDQMTTEEQLFNALWREMTKGASTDYASFSGDWRSVRDSDNGAIVIHYTNQTASKQGTVETNCKSMKEGNESSLINRFRSNLSAVLTDINRGPSFAYRMMAASTGHSIQNIIDGIIEVNDGRWQQEAAQEELRINEYDAALADFNRRPNIRRFEEYECELLLLEQHKLAMSNYSQMNGLLRKLKSQLEALADNYYLRLSRVMDSLSRTFKENKNALASERHTLRIQSSFAVPMMTIADLSKTLDEQVAVLNIPDTLSAFVSELINNEDKWIQEDERTISKFVRDFFVDNLFSNFAGHTITEFLMDKYDLDSKDAAVYELLQNLVYDDYINPLTQRARPLFYFNSEIWDTEKINSLAYISVPSIATPIVSAAERKEEVDPTWKVKKSALTDRIFVMYSACVLPFSSYNNAKLYEDKYRQGNQVGAHYYEGKGVEGNDFKDWRELPSLIPCSYMEPISDIENLYELANKYGVLNDDMEICSPNNDEFTELEKMIRQGEELLAQVALPENVGEYNKLAERLIDYKFNSMLPTGEFFSNDGSNEEDCREILRKEHFYLEPAHRMMVKKIIDRVDELMSRARDIGEKLGEKSKSSMSSADDFAKFSEALFAGAFKIEGRNISYIQDDLGFETEHILTKTEDEFRFSSIPMYQAYVTYQSFSDGLKKEIKERTNQIIDTDPVTLKNSISTMKEMLSVQRINAYRRQSSNFVEGSAIDTFLVNLGKKFTAEFLPLYGSSN